MNRFLKFLSRWRKPENEILDEFAQRIVKVLDERLEEPCDCPVCQPPLLLMVGETVYINPSREMLEDCIRLEMSIRSMPAERMQDMPEREQ